MDKEVIDSELMVAFATGTMEVEYPVSVSASHVSFSQPADYAAVHPPSTNSVVPVVNFAASDAR